MRPQYGRLRKCEIGKGFSDVWLADGEIEDDLGGLVKMFGRNQLGCQYPIRACGEMEEFSRG